MYSSFLKQQNFIILVQSTDQGKDAWWYVNCTNKLAAERLKGVCKLGVLETIPLEEYGEIVKSGWGKNPPQEAIDEIYKKYN